jgi:anthranilate phosphoribosyltransferase
MSLSPYIHQLRAKQNLTADQTREAFDIIFAGHSPETDIGDFLLELHAKGETTDEILGAVQSMRAKAIPITAPENAIDIVGTGGDARGTLNISTAAALVVAACGVPVAKHGNRAATSKSGSSDVLAALGINLEPDFAVLEQCLSEANLCFLFAPRHHPAMRHVAAIRKKLGVRTLFNLLGPLTNPANVKKHMIGVYAEDYLLPMAQVLRGLGSKAAWLTYGKDGLDEITTSTDSAVVSLTDQNIDAFTLSPVDYGIRPATLSELQGGDAAVNAAAIQRLLKGEKGPYRDIVCLNAAAALIVASKAPDMKTGLSLAAEALDSGAAHNGLHLLIKLTNRIGI